MLLELLRITREEVAARQAAIKSVSTGEVHGTTGRGKDVSKRILALSFYKVAQVPRIVQAEGEIGWMDTVTVCN